MKVRFITFGCSRNQADTELMKGLCRHEIVDQEQDVTVINSCFVKGETEKKIIKLLHETKGKIVLAGCLAQARPQLIEAFPQVSFIGTRALNQINDAIEEQVVDISKGSPNFCDSRVMNNPLISIVPISDGCLGNCNYCCTRQARGRLKSRTIENILKQVKQDLKLGVKELWLTGQDTGCYGFDINKTLPELINKITALEGGFRVRIGMMNPQHALKILPELKKCFNEKVYKFIHLPIQSGSNKVLKEMNRDYTVQDFMKVANEFKDFNLSTDVICGYPTETKSDWRETIELIKKLRPGVLNISRFAPRPGTQAQLMKQLPSGVSKNRSRELTRIYEKICLENNKQLINHQAKVLITEPGTGRDECYRVVNVNAPIGSIITIKITSAGLHHLNA